MSELVILLLGLMVTSVTKSGTQKLPRKFRLSQPTDIAIHRKALEEHFLMVPLVFRYNHFQGEKCCFIPVVLTYLMLPWENHAVFFQEKKIKT
jgi:hypothetical protein